MYKLDPSLNGYIIQVTETLIPIDPTNSQYTEFKTKALEYSKAAPNPTTGVRRVIGTTGVDSVVVYEGSKVDATFLGASQDLVYFPGSWETYTKEVNGTTLNITSKSAKNAESVKVTAGARALNDMLIFANGAVESYKAKLALEENVDVALEDIPSFNPGLTSSKPFKLVSDNWEMMSFDEIKNLLSVLP